MNGPLVTLGEYGTVGYDERVGIWQEDAGTDSLVTFWRVEPVTIPPTEQFNNSILATIQGQLYIPVVSASARGKKVSCKIIADAVSVNSTILCYMWDSFPFEDPIVISREES